jgi:hypothetical protein
MLPNAIKKELFAIEYKINDIAIEYIIEELKKFNFEVSNILDCDASIIVDFEREINKTKGELRIDRIEQCFEISARIGDATFLPISGGWSIIEEYLSQLSEFS